MVATNDGCGAAATPRSLRSQSTAYLSASDDAAVPHPLLTVARPAPPPTGEKHVSLGAASGLRRSLSGRDQAWTEIPRVTFRVGLVSSRSAGATECLTVPLLLPRVAGILRVRSTSSGAATPARRSLPSKSGPFSVCPRQDSNLCHRLRRTMRVGSDASGNLRSTSAGRTVRRPGTASDSGQRVEGCFVGLG